MHRDTLDSGKVLTRIHPTSNSAGGLIQVALLWCLGDGSCRRTESPDINVHMWHVCQPRQVSRAIVGEAQRGHEPRTVSVKEPCGEEAELAGQLTIEVQRYLDRARTEMPNTLTHNLTAKTVAETRSTFCKAVRDHRLEHVLTSRPSQ